MQTVGEKLRKARLEKNATLDEVYKRTKIHPQVLEALEQDRVHNFLNAIYIKGFLKTYAQYLGLDGEKLFKEYAQREKLKAPGPEFSLKKKHPPSSKISPFLALRVVAVLLIAAALVLYLRFFSRHIFQPKKEAPRPKVEVKVAPAAEVKSEELILEVRTLEACWMRLAADGQVIFEKTLPKGRRERWQAKEKIELRLGKPEALEIFLNGRQIDLKKAQVKRSLVITHEGIVGK